MRDDDLSDDDLIAKLAHLPAANVNGHAVLHQAAARIAELRQERDEARLSFDTQCDITDREAARATAAEAREALLRSVLDTVMNIPDMSDAQLEQLKANCRAALQQVAPTAGKEKGPQAAAPRSAT